MMTVYLLIVLFVVLLIAGALYIYFRPPKWVQKYYQVPLKRRTRVRQVATLVVVVIFAGYFAGTLVVKSKGNLHQLKAEENHYFDVAKFRKEFPEETLQAKVSDQEYYEKIKTVYGVLGNAINTAI
jgi:predicted PurR-regulated permease PerM